MRYTYIIATIVAFVAIALLLRAYLAVIVYAYIPALSPYLAGILSALDAIIGILGSYMVYRILLSISVSYVGRQGNKETVELTKLALRILFYVVVISIVLAATGISLSAALAGGAIGGIVLGLAVQNIATSILAGFFLSSSRTLLPDEIVLIHSWMLGQDLLCKVVRINAMFTEVITQNGQRLRIASSVLLSSAAFTSLGRGSPFAYAFPVTVNADAGADLVRANAERELKGIFEKLELPRPEVYFTSKSGGSNVFTVKISFNDIVEVNGLLHAVNTAFDDAHTRAKSLPPGKPSRGRR